MNLTKNVKRGLTVSISAAALVFGVFLATANADATVTPTVSVIIQNQSNVTITSAPIGTMVNASATVASSTASTSPLGTVDFNLFSNTSCSGTPSTESNVALLNGTAKSATSTLAAGGLSYTVHYDGQTDLYTTADSGCVSLSANQISPSITTSLSSNSITAGSSVFDSATLNGPFQNASGTVMYSVYTDTSCSANLQDAGTKTVTNGIVPNSNSIQFNTPGTYYFQAVYSGDLNNARATSSCQSEVLTVNATSTPPAPGTGSIFGTVFNDKNDNDKFDGGDTGLSGWTVWLHKADSSNSWWKWSKHDSYDDPIVATATTDGNGNYSFGSLAAGSYFVEEQEKTGWDQTSDDTKVNVSGSNSTRVDFSNVEKGSGNDNNDNDNDDDSSHGHGNHKGQDKENPGRHLGWSFKWSFQDWQKKFDR